MKKILLSVLLTGVLSLNSFINYAQGNVYYVGHSLININIPYQVWKIQDLAEVPNFFKHHINIGASLQLNWHDTGYNPHPIWDPELGEEIDRGSNHFVELLNPYDHIVITEAVPIRNYHTDTVVKYMTNFIELAQEGNPDIEKYLYATWEGDVADGDDWRSTLDTLVPIWENIADETELEIGGGTVNIIPGNLAMMNLYDELQEGPIGSFTSISDFFEPDGIHLSHDGNYLIACLMSIVVYDTNPIGQDSIRGGSYTDDYCIVDEVARLRIQEIAMETACEYARSGYTSEYCDNASIMPAKDAVISIYPNPSNGNFTIQSNSADLSEYEITDATGRLILMGQFQGNTEIDISRAPAGLYFVIVRNKTGEVINKLIIN
jgi:hypothetical protein